MDVVISNCVINLSADKDRVLREAFRVLKPGGRFAVSDVVTRGEILPEIRKSVLLWVGCIAGALEENEYRGKLRRPDSRRSRSSRREFTASRTPANFCPGQGIDVDAIAPQVDGKFMSAFVRAVKASRCWSKDVLRTDLLPLEKREASMQGHYNVLFLCTGNSARSIMAEAILNSKGRPNFTAYSAGSHPSGTVRPEALRQLEMAHMPTEGLRSKSMG